jgi:hypothetical protein
LPPPTAPAARLLVSKLITSLHPLKAQRLIKPIILIHRALSVFCFIAQLEGIQEIIVFVTSLIDILGVSCQCRSEQFAAKA